MELEDLKKEYDKLQVKYGAKELDSIGMSNGNDLNILKYAGFKVIALNR